MSKPIQSYDSVPVVEANSTQEGNHGSGQSSGSSHGGTTHIRRLYSKTVLLQDWGEEKRHDDSGTSASYWELFIDLLLVAAASSIADTYRDTHNIFQFILVYLIVVNGWFLYSYHLSARFENSAFITSIIFFMYSLGFGWTTANIRDFSNIIFTATTNNEAISASAEFQGGESSDINGVDSETVKEFIFGAMVLQCSVLIMMGEIALSLQRAHYFCSLMSINVALALCGLFIAFIGTKIDSTITIHTGLWIAAITELFFEVGVTKCINIRRFIPINIEQSQERFNALGLVMLGETVVSITQTYREVTAGSAAIKQDNDAQVRYYEVLALSLLLIFMITLSLFNTSPSPDYHALRRSKLHAVTLMMIQKLIGLPLLAVGVSVKLIVEAVMKQEELSLFGYQCMSYGVGVTLSCNFIIRLLHHAGRKHFKLNSSVHNIHDNVVMDYILKTWWVLVFICSCLPFIWYYMGITTQDPVTTTLYHAVLVFVMCFVEAAIIHILLAVTAHPRSSDEHIYHRNSSTSDESKSGERVNLLSSYCV